MPVLTEELLRSLYLVQKLSERDIGERFKVSQACINRYRKKWGIPTVGKTGRLSSRLPATLDDTQSQIVVGSLLGDGCMTATSPLTARFHEGHGLRQEGYLRWKGEVLCPFVSSFRAIEKKDKATGRVFPGIAFSTHSCEVLRPYYDLFYPEPMRTRQFPRDLHARMTPLILAVWYMDDGSVSSRGEPRIAFGLCDVSRSRALRALRSLGLKPVVYGEGGNQTIEFPKQKHLFRSLVEEFLHPEMQYKLPDDRFPGQAVHLNARSLSAEEARQRYEGGMSKEDISRMYKVGVSTVARRLHAAGTTMRKSGPTRRSLDVPTTLQALIGYTPECWAELAEERQNEAVDEILKLLRGLPFPYQPFLDQEAAEEEFQKVSLAQMGCREGIIEPNRRVGLRLCQPFFPNRYRAHSEGTLSAFDAWNSDKELKRAIRFQLGVGDPVTPHRVLRAITMRCRTPVIFRPTVACFLYRKYCPSGGVVWDPCSGYGGRLLGAAAAGVRYLGTDVDLETVEGNRSLAEVIKARDAQVILSPAENFDPPPVDMVFTSPPYFSRERYSEGSSQSFRKGDFAAWVEEFLSPLMTKARSSLPLGGFLALNVADVHHRRKVVPLVKTVQEIASQTGFLQTEVLQMPLAKLNRQNPHEPILIFQKR